MTVKKDTTSAAAGAAKVLKTATKVTYDKPGQKYPTPDERDPLNRFYSSLYEQKPCSEMARKWLLERGLLPDTVVEELALSKALKKVKIKD